MGYLVTGDNFEEFLRSGSDSEPSIGQRCLSYDVNGHAEITSHFEQLAGDMQIIHSLYNSADDLTIAGRGQDCLLEIQINLSANPIHYRDDQRREQHTPGCSANIVFLPAENNAMDLFLPKGAQVETFDVHLPLHLLSRYAGESVVIDRLLHDIQQSRGGRLSPRPIPISSDILQIIDQMQQCTFEGFSRKVYLESKVYEMIAILHKRAGDRTDDVKITPTDEQKIRAAAVYIRGHLDRPLTIHALAHLLGINQTKLKAGFKAIFGQTIFGYLQELRMAKAKSYLLDTDLSVQEIGTLVGYSSSSNFSIAFKRCYGFPPQALRR